MKNKLSYLAVLCVYCSLSACSGQTDRTINVTPGAEQTQEYLPLLQQKRVGILTNHTATIGKTHLVDSLVASGVHVQTIFAPEHGFRGAVDAGGHVSDAIDPKTGIPIISLYGSLFMPTDSMMNQLDIMIYDIQDVGLRFYTYLSSLYYLMEACARNQVPLILLDRPNPNGHYVDGPILDMQYRSFVGIIPVPVVHGMTFGELSGMINGKYWLKDSLQCDVTVVKCQNYTHNTLYQIPIGPSPNLPDNRSIYLYPALCPFEATPVSLGRGTDTPFQMYGHPDMTGYSFSFTPVSIPGVATHPPQQDQLCHGVDLRTEPSNEEIFKEGFTLKYVVDAYQNLNKSIGIGEKFFRSNFFEKLVGVSYIRTMILEDKSADEIKACWKEDVEQFKKDRAPYLLYPLE